MEIPAPGYTRSGYIDSNLNRAIRGEIDESDSYRGFCKRGGTWKGE